MNCCFLDIFHVYTLVGCKSCFPASCPTGYTEFRGICYKAFNTKKTFSGAAAACGEDGGTLAMPQDAETDAFLVSLRKSVSDSGLFWFGLHDQREAGHFEWVDGSALGTYSNWAPGQPNNYGGNQDCVYYPEYPFWKWADESCDLRIRFICQAVPGRS
ncbi:perlucin-like protein [Branchiostoma floridae x Branchiostoma japonicum]